MDNQNGHQPNGGAGNAHPSAKGFDHSPLVNGDYEQLQGMGAHLDDFQPAEFDLDATAVVVAEVLRVGSDENMEVVPSPYPIDQSDAVLLAGGHHDDDGNDHVYDVGEIYDPPLPMSGALPPPPPLPLAGGPLVLPEHDADNADVALLDLINISLNVAVPAAPPLVLLEPPHAQAISTFTSAELTLVAAYQLLRPHMPVLQQQTVHARVWALQDELRAWTRYAHGPAVVGQADDRLQNVATAVSTASGHLARALSPPGGANPMVATLLEAFCQALMGWPDLGEP